MFIYQHDEEKNTISADRADLTIQSDVSVAKSRPFLIQKVSALQSRYGNRTVQRMLNGGHSRKSPLPSKLKTGIETLSNLSMDNVTVHYNSDKPEHVGALAFAQGPNIHLAPGQEQHLPHEAWHVVQQKQGRVQPTIQVKGVSINDDAALEREADVMAAKALQRARVDQVQTRPTLRTSTSLQRGKRSAPSSTVRTKPATTGGQHHLVQRIVTVNGKRFANPIPIPANEEVLLTAEQNMWKAAIENCTNPDDIAAMLYAMDQAREVFEFNSVEAAIVEAEGRIENIYTAEDRLSNELKDQPAFTNFDLNEAWRLLLDGRQQQERGKFGFENEKGYMAALMTAFQEMVASLKEDLTDEIYLKLHDLAVSGVHTVSGDAMKPGYRTDEMPGPEFGLNERTWSVKGAKELAERYEDEQSVASKTLMFHPSDMVGQDELKKNAAIHLKGINPYEPANALAEQVIELYTKELEAAEEGDRKLAAIANCCQRLDQAHLFLDGNIRTVAFLVLNKLLLQNGFVPVILDEPNVFDCRSTDELVEAIKEGQARFKEYKK